MAQELVEQTVNEELEEAKRRLAEAVERLVTEDDEPVDNLLSAKQQRLLVEPLYSSWTPPRAEDAPDTPRIFLADANVGVFASPYQPPLVPDMFLSLDVKTHENLHEKRHRSYFIWEFGKAPEVAIEIVSNRVGNELGSKLRNYARFGVAYYIVYDPFHELSDQLLHFFKLNGTQYKESTNEELSSLGLGLTLWTGEFEAQNEEWLRWCDAQGNLIPTGAERAKLEAERANLEAERAGLEAERANREAERANLEAQRAEKLAAKLRELGVDPQEL